MRTHTIFIVSLPALVLGILGACIAPPRPAAPPAAPAPAPGTPGEEAGPTAAPSPEPLDLLAMLVESGALTQEQYDALIEDPRFAAFTGTELDPSSTEVYIPPPVAERNPRLIIDESGLSIRSADGESRIDIGGRIQADATVHSRNSQAGTDITDGTELRRSRLEMKGTLPGDWIWAAETDFANNGTSIKDFWMGVRDDDGSTLTFGHQKQPYSLAVEMSSNDIPFTERGVDVALIIPFVDRAIGVRTDVLYEDSFLAAGLFGESVSGNPVDDEGWGAAARFVHAPVRTEEEVLHFGVRGAFRKPMSSTKSVRIADETTNMSNFAVVDTGVITDVNATNIYGAEFGYVDGPVSVVGELNLLEVDRKGGDDLDFQSWSVETAYSLTGESRAEAYRLGSGEFKRLEPDDPARGLDLSSGAWELAARLASIDLNDGAVSGGEEKVLTMGVNWYPTTFTRFLFGWSNVVSTRGGTAATADADGLDVVTLRAQMTF